MKKEVKTSIDGLQIGMFVSRLDRPWIQTSFALQGVEIKRPEDIEQLRAYSNYVFVDVERGPTPDPRYWVFTSDPSPQTNRDVRQAEKAVSGKTDQKKEYAKLRKTSYQDTATFDEESKIATEISLKLHQNFSQITSDLRRGRNLDLDVVREGVSAMTDSIIRNPSAMMWVTQLKKLDEYTYSRALGTSVWCATFGRHLGMERSEIEQLALGGLLLDIGKSRLPVKLLKKTGRLSDKEMAIMRAHVKQGIKLLVSASEKHKGQKIAVSIFQMIATHHERADGSGYPQNLINFHIPIFGRIAGIVDSYDAMTSSRPYHPNLAPSTPHEAISELYGLRNNSFQSELVEQFIQTVGLYPTGSLVELSTGEVGVVVATSGLRRLRPSVMLLLDSEKQPLALFRQMDLSQLEKGPTVIRGLSAGAYGIDMKELFL